MNRQLINQRPYGHFPGMTHPEDAIGEEDRPNPTPNNVAWGPSVPSLPILAPSPPPSPFSWFHSFSHPIMFSLLV